MTLAAALDQAIRAVCPIEGISIGRQDDKATWSVDYAPDATNPQKTAAQNVINNFVYDVVASDDSDFKAQIDVIVNLPNNVQRAVILLLLQELNILRQHPAIALAPRTKAQLVTALKGLGA